MCVWAAAALGSDLLPEVGLLGMRAGAEGAGPGEGILFPLNFLGLLVGH